MIVTIYGVSDDLIEVESTEGSISDEYPCDGAGKLLVIGPSGEVVEVIVALDECWSATARAVRGNSFTKIETAARPDSPESGDMAIRITFDDHSPPPLVYQLERN